MSKLASWLIVAGLCISAAGVAQAQAPDRFDYLVREDMFRGFAGDRTAFDRAMALCEVRLAENSNNAEALVWHGNGLLFQAGEAFRTGDFDQATTRARKAVAEMAQAVVLRPDDVSVLVARGAALLAAGMRLEDRGGRSYVETAVGDFEKVLALQQPHLESLPQHPKGELFAALAEGWSRLGDVHKSRLYLTRMVAELPDTPYSAAAAARLDNPGPRPRITCLGCHTR